MRQITNQDWLINECSTVLKKYNNPELNFLEFTYNTDFKPENINNFGINIITSESSNLILPHIDSLPEKIHALTREISIFNTQIGQVRIKIPKLTRKFIIESNFPDIIIDKNKIAKAEKDKIAKIIYSESFQFINRNIPANQQGEKAKSYPIALVYDNSIMLWWDLDSRTQANRTIMKYILDEALKFIPEDKFKREKPKDWEIDKFKKIMVSFSSDKERRLKQNLAETQNIKEQSLAQYSRTTIDEENYIKEIALTKRLKRGLEDKAKASIKYFNEFKKLKSWKVMDNEKIQFTIEGITMEHLEDKLTLPTIDATVEIKTGTFTLLPGDDKYKDIDPIHPHAFSYGRVCLGNYSTIYPKLVAMGQFNQVLDLICQFIETYNADSPAVEYWKYRAMIKKRKSWGNFSSDEKEKAMKEWQEITNNNEISDNDTVAETPDEMENVIEDFYPEDN